MSSPEEQILQAIAVANDHNRTQDRSVYEQAIHFLNQVRLKADQTWRVALSLFLATNEQGTRRYETEVRLYALTVINSFLEMNQLKAKLDDEAFVTLRDQFLHYLRSEYLFGPSENANYYLRNKFSQVFSLFFLATYESQWPNFFDEIFTLLKPPPESGAKPLNSAISSFFLRLVQEISSEVADQVLKNARSYSAERHARDGRIRDLVRDRDAARINEAVLAIIADAKQRLDQLNAAGDQVRKKEAYVEEIVDLGIRAFASYVPWIDINLTVTPETIPMLFSLLQEEASGIRLATCTSLTRIVTKGLKVPSDKLKLIQVLSLGPVLEQLEAQTRAQIKALANRSEPLESFRESLSIATNFLGIELINLCNNTALSPDEVQAATNLLLELMPTFLHFLEDELEDVSLWVIPLLTEILNTYKKAKQASPHGYMTAERRAFLDKAIAILVRKLKYEEEDEPDDWDDDDFAEFENFRKENRKAIDTVAALDLEMVTNYISQWAHTALATYESGNELPWDQAELAIYLVFTYGELGAKERGKGRLAFCMAPNIPKEERKTTDYSEYPLTPLGELMQSLIRSGISTYKDPVVAMQFFETVTRYADFFKVRKEYILPALEAFLDYRGVHHKATSVRKRVFYLFHRFVQALRIDIDIQHVPTILQAIQDVLTIEKPVLRPAWDDSDYEGISDDSLAEALAHPTLFDSQIYMFEAAGALISTLWSLPEPQAAALQTVCAPLLAHLSRYLQMGMDGTEDDDIRIVTIHHCIQALGNIPKGFPEFPSPVPENYIMPPIAEFRQIGEAILVSLGIVGEWRIVREAARFAFGRLIFAAGPSVADFIPRLMGSLLAHFEISEFVDFISFLSHMTHKLQSDFRGVLEEVITPLGGHVSNLIAQPITGTDDRITRVDTKKAYLNFLNTTMTSNLGSVFVSPANAPNLGPFLETILQIALDTSDPLNQKLAIAFTTKFVLAFGQIAPTANGAYVNPPIVVPGIEQFIYQRVLVVAFSIPFLPDFNVKDAGAIAALNEIANLLQAIVKARGDEAVTYISTVFLPSQNLPPGTIMELTNNMTNMDKRGFQKYLSDLVKASRS
ncbi:ARM repeat-containing protein [Serendipita vermifera]|nr:ARM repeat-containing protein [Serendipita vermifera]